MAKLLTRVLLMGLGVLAALGLATLWAERYRPVGKPIFRLDEELLHEPIPGARRLLAMEREIGGRKIPIAFDERGYRRPDLGSALPRNPERPLVAVVGDSLVLAESVRFEETFVEQLGSQLASAGRPVDVINAGVSGYGPDQTLLRLQARLEELRPDHVVLVICAHNDYGDLARNKLFHVDDQDRLQRLRPTLDPPLVQRWQLRAREGERHPLRRIYARGKRAARARAAREREGDKPYVAWYLAAAPEEWADYERSVAEPTPVVRSLLVDTYDADVALRPSWPSTLGKQRLARGLAKAWAELGLDLTVVVVPSAIDVDPDFTIQVDRTLNPDYDPARLTASWCEDWQELEPIDLYPVYAALEDPGAAFIGDIDFHWSAYGQAVAAEAVAARLAR